MVGGNVLLLVKPYWMPRLNFKMFYPGYMFSGKEQQ